MSKNLDNPPDLSESLLQPELEGVLGGLAMSSLTSAELTPEEEVDYIFRSGNLLVRGLRTWPVRSDALGRLEINYDIIDGETADLFGKSDERHAMEYISSTLLLPGKHIPTYENFGFMFNGATAELHHIHHQDSGSVGHGDNFSAAESNLQSLADLAAVVSDEEPKMNEVNATFKQDDLIGIFALEVKKPVGKVSALLMQQRIAQLTGKEFPVYVYDIDAGEITRWQPAAEDVQGVIDAAYRPGLVRDAYSHELVDSFAK